MSVRPPTAHPPGAMMNIAVMGAGSWATAFAALLAGAGIPVRLWARRPEIAEAITQAHENPEYHPGIRLPSALTADVDPHAVLADADLVVLCVPAQSLRDNLADWGAAMPAGSTVVSLMKGIELGSGLRMTEVIRDALGWPADRLTALSGPNLAREVLAGQPAAGTIAGPDEQVARGVAELISGARYRAYWTSDLIGTELAGAMKNVIAVANGCAVGLGFGENAQAALITRGLAEMTRLGVALGAQPVTYLGLAGVGDLIATCSSPLSRNRSFGVALGEGLSVAEATVRVRQTCEAIRSARPIVKLAADAGVAVPITEQVLRVVHEDMPPREMLAAFMSRSVKAEGQ